MTLQPVAIGDAGTAAEIEGPPAMLAVPQPDAMIDAGLYGPLVVRAACVRGAGHRYDGTPRQDDFCLGVGGASNEWFLAVVADGVSSGPSSHVASRAAVRFGVKLLTERLASVGPEAIDWDEIVGSVAGFVLSQARSQAGDQGLDARSAARIMATTIAFAIIPVHAMSDGVRRCTVLPVGDTSVWALSATGSWRSVTAVKNEGAAVAGSATLALPLLPGGSLVAMTAELRAGDALFVMTDGVGDPLGDGSGEVGHALARLWATPPDRYAFAAQVDFRRRSHTDDRTVVGIWPDQEKAPDGGGDLSESIQTVGAPVESAPYAPTGSAVPSGSIDVAPSVPDGPYGTGSNEPGRGVEPWEPVPWEPTPWSPS